jgi:hypothetical protein
MRLSKPQKKMLAELQQEKGAWVECYGNEYRTAKALKNMGFIEISEEWGPVKTHDDRFEARSMAGQIRQSVNDPALVYELGENGSMRWSCRIEFNGEVTKEEVKDLGARIVEALNELKRNGG